MRSDFSFTLSVSVSVSVSSFFVFLYSFGGVSLERDMSLFPSIFLYHCRFRFVVRVEYVVRFSLPDGV